MEIKIGLIGGGYWGKNLIKDFYSLGALHTICDVDFELLKKYKDKYPDVNVTDNWNDILHNKEINAVCISLPADMHYQFAKHALENGKDVYVEKPITLDETEAEELIKLAKCKNKILMVGHLLHYHPHIEKLKELVKTDVIGKIRNITCNRFNLGKFRTAENVLWSFAPHDISIVLSLCNDILPDRVVCFGKDFITNSIHDITNTIMFFDKLGTYVNINVSWLNPFKEQKLVITGDKGMIVFDDTKKEDKLVLYENYLTFDGNNLPVPNKIKGEIIGVDFEYPLLRECKHFIECCKDRREPITNGLEGLRVIKVLNACHNSLINGKETKLKQIDNVDASQSYFSHPTATIDEGVNIGENTKIWHYSHISKGSFIGMNCNIGQNVYVAPGAKLGNGCKVQNNVSIYKGVICQDNVFLGPSCVFTNDINPRAEYPKNGNYISTIVKKGATIGANATIVCGNTIGEYALVGAGSVVTKDVDPYAIVVGNPAKKIGIIDKQGTRSLF